MAFDLSSIQTAAENLPPRVLVYGTGGIGKTTFAAHAPNPIFLRTEDGTGEIDVPAFPVAGSFDDVMQAMETLATQDHKFQSLVVDSLDWLEPLIWQKVCADFSQETPQKSVNSIEQIGYGKGYVMAVNYWQQYIDAINYLRREKNMTVIQIAHAEIKRFDDPTADPYDRYVIKLHKLASAKLVEHCDIVGFANYRMATKTIDVGMNQKRTRAVGNGERFLFLEERPAFIAKNRYGMPPEMPLDWSRFAAALKFFNTEATQTKKAS